MQSEVANIAPKLAIDMREMQVLQWYFSRGMTAFEHSTFGSMLERQELFSVANQYQPAFFEICDDDGNVIARERRVTARPTAELRVESGYTPDPVTLQRFAHYSSLLMKVERCSRLAYQVLELLYGDHGELWAPTEPYGRLGSLFHLTAKGQKLLEAERAAQNARDISDKRRMWNLCAVQDTQPNKERGLALSFCLQQALRLEQHALQVWSSVKPSRRG